ncbi:MAG: hypothetical protein AB7K71_14095 [Polyangiaceae bacterium]
MSRGIMIYSVDEGALTGALGSNDTDLLEALERTCSDGTWPQVMQLIKSGSCRGDAEHQIFAFEALCKYFGVELDNGAVSPIRQSTIEDADQALLTHPCGLSFDQLVYGHGVFPFTLASDFPQFGHWSAQSVRAAAPVLEQDPPEHDDETLESILLAVSDWITIAHARNNALFGFIY